MEDVTRDHKQTRRSSSSKARSKSRKRSGIKPAGEFSKDHDALKQEAMHLFHQEQASKTLIKQRLKLSDSKLKRLLGREQATLKTMIKKSRPRFARLHERARGLIKKMFEFKLAPLTTAHIQ